MDMEILEQYCSKFEKLHPNRVRNGAGRLYSPKEGEKNFNPPQSPASISNKRFFHLYRMGYPDSLKG